MAMPSLPRSCGYPGCPRTVVGTARCPEHAVDNRRRTNYQARKVAYRMKLEQPWCTYCGTPETKDNPLTIDHIIPLIRGGSDARDNKCVACRRCNRRKSDAVNAIEAIKRTASETSNDVVVG